MIIGHSAGSLAALGWLQHLNTSPIALCVLVSGFKDDLGWDALPGLFTQPYDWALLREKAHKYVLFHSDDDPYIPLQDGEFLATQLAGELRVRPGQRHFNMESTPPYRTFPEVYELVAGTEQEQR